VACRVGSLFDRYTNVEVSRELQEAINNGLLGGMMQNMGVEVGDQSPYTVRVLEIAATDYEPGPMGRGALPPYETPGYGELSIDERRDLSNKWQQGTELDEAWRKGLIRNRESLASELGKESGM